MAFRIYECHYWDENWVRVDVSLRQERISNQLPIYSLSERRLEFCLIDTAPARCLERFLRCFIQKPTGTSETPEWYRQIWMYNQKGDVRRG